MESNISKYTVGSIYMTHFGVLPCILNNSYLPCTGCNCEVWVLQTCLLETGFRALFSLSCNNIHYDVSPTNIFQPRRKFGLADLNLK